MVFNQALDSWDTDDFARVFKLTFNALSLKDLPLMDCVLIVVSLMRLVLNQPS